MAHLWILGMYLCMYVCVYICRRSHLGSLWFQTGGLFLTSVHAVCDTTVYYLTVYKLWLPSSYIIGIYQYYCGVWIKYIRNYLLIIHLQHKIWPHSYNTVFPAMDELGLRKEWMQMLSKHLPNSYSPLHVFPHSEQLSVFSSLADMTFTGQWICICSLLLMFT